MANSNNYSDNNTMRVENMKAAVFDRPGRIAFTMTHWNLLRLAKSALFAAIRGDDGISITTGDLEMLEASTEPSSEGRAK